MNELIKQLAEEAGFILWSDESHKPQGQVIDWSSDYDKDLEKFALLIVEKCAQICKTVNSVKVVNAPDDYQEGREWGSLMCMEEIKNHFGVE